MLFLNLYYFCEKEKSNKFQTQTGFQSNEKIYLNKNLSNESHGKFNVKNLTNETKKILVLSLDKPKKRKLNNQMVVEKKNQSFEVGVWLTFDKFK